MGADGGAGATAVQSTGSGAHSGTLTGGSGGAGGVGMTAAGGASFENGGTVRDSLSGDGLGLADAIRFTGDNNWLGLLSTSVIEGNVVGSAFGDTLGLSGSTDASFNTAIIGPSGQYQGFAGFQKLGTSTRTLTGTTTALTPWQILSGRLVTSSDASLGDAAGRLTLDGGTLATDTGTTYTANGVISGSGSLTKAGGGTAVFAADNTYTGETTVAEGTLLLGNGGTTGAIAGNVANSGTLAFNRSDATVFSGAISGTGSAVQRGTGTTTLAGANTYSGGISVQAGTLAGSAASLGSGAIANNAALVMDQASDGVLNNVLSGSGRVTKTGAGALALGGNSAAFAGSMQVAAGTLAVNGALGGLLTVGNGATLAGTGSVGTALVQSGGAGAPDGNGIGTLNVAGNLTLAQGSSYQLNGASDGRSDQLRVS